MSINKTIQQLGSRFLMVCLPLLIPFSVIADETEIFYQQETSRVNANVLFILDASGSMDVVLSDSGGKTRMQVMKETFRDVLDQAPENLNIGLMSYANADFLRSYQWDSVKGVTFPISEIDGVAADIIGTYSAVDNLPDASPDHPVRSFLADVVDTWQPAGYTPIVDSLYEAARYFRGENSVWGKYPPAFRWAAHPASYTGDLSCENPTKEECRLEWGECNGTETSCEAKPVKSCCNWIDNDDGGYCVNEDYSCSVDISHCEHTTCASISGTAKYKTPIEYTCQSNYVVLMSDGKPEYPYYISRSDDGTGQYPKSAELNPAYDDPSVIPDLFPAIDSSVISTDIPALIGLSSCADSPQGYASGTCGPELTSFLATRDQNSSLEGEQTIETYTVAFGMADEPEGTEYLASLATAENGAYTADNAEQLAEAFKEVFGEIQKKSLSFSSPSFSVSEDSLLSHGSDVFIPVFDSKNTPLWSGNLRKFSLSSGNGIVGANNTAALTSSGNFTENAQDLWSATAHGSDVKVGGSASKLPSPANRNLKTDADGNTLADINSDVPTTTIPTELFGSGEPTRRTEHDLHYHWRGFEGDEWWPKISKDIYGNANHGWYIDCDGNKVEVDARGGKDLIGPVNIEEVTTCGDTTTKEERDTLLNFARGYEAGAKDDSAQGRKHMGDILNTKPVVVDYGSKSLVLVATNEGYLHAIDTDTGVEEWAFMPSDLLKNQKVFFEDSEEKRHVYGLDGEMTLWNHDADKDGTIVRNSETGEGRFLFFGMRRGGYMYYALDITNPATPTVAWKISPKVMTGAKSQGYGNLGETWSKPTLSRMRVKKAGSAIGEVKYVLVFGGGYDPRMDEQDVSARGSDSFLGADVFIADALTGDQIWSLKGHDETRGPVSRVSDSIPGDIRVLDMDNNGELDRLYFGDTGGNIWRVDMSPSLSDTGTFEVSPRLTHFAALGGGSSNTLSGEVDKTDDGDNRKFFYEPDTALRLNHGEPVLTISIGSGYRTHPLDLGDKDRFYVLHDVNVYNEPAGGTDSVADPAVITANDLLPNEGSETGAGSSFLDSNKKGWYLKLNHNGEKVLASSLTFLDKVIFTTFAMADERNQASVAGPCEPLVTTARAYVLDLLTGRPVANLNREVEKDEATNEDIIVNDGFIIAGIGEILDSPQLIFSKLTDGDGGQCSVGRCQQSVSIRIGKLEVPILDLENSLNSGDASYSEMVDLTKLLPRLYWRDNDVGGINNSLAGEEQEEEEEEDE